MSTSTRKPDKISLLASLRRQATENETLTLPPARERAAAAAVAAPVAASAPPGAAIAPLVPTLRPAPYAPSNGTWLERTSITLKTPDREALKALTLFLLQRGQQHVQTSTVIQATLQFAANHLDGKGDEFLGAFESVRRADRRKVT